MDGLITNTVKENVAIVDIGDTGEDMRHKGMEVKIAFPMSHNHLDNRRGVNKMMGKRLIGEIAQRTLSDLTLPTFY
jgi:hypothetical protein